MNMQIPQLDGFNIFNDTVHEVVTGGFSLSPTDVLNNIIKIIFAEVRDFSKSAITVLVIAVLSSIISSMNSSSGGGAASRAAFYTFFTIISGLLLNCFYKAAAYGTQTISDISAFITKLTPLLTLTLAASGKAASAAAFSPILATAVYITSLTAERCLIPLTVYSAVLSTVGNIDDKHSISGFVSMIKSVQKWIMTLLLTLFGGINVIYGFSGAALDAVSAKAVKFAVGSLIPVIGGFLSDSIETVAASAGLIKSAAGIGGVIMICAIGVVPTIKLGIMQLMLKLCAAAAEPICDKRICNMIKDMAESITGIFALVVLEAIMFIINICIILKV